MPHVVSGQYGKVEKKTRGLLFDESHLSSLNSYFASRLAWYKVERFVQNQEDGKKFRLARWHIIMLLKYLCCQNNKINLTIDKKTETNSKLIENFLMDDDKANEAIRKAIEIIDKCLSTKIENYLVDRKTFERKESTPLILEYLKENN